MKLSPIKAVITLAAASLASIASAAIIYEVSPDSTGLPLYPSGEGGYLQNQASGVSWLAPVLFSESVTLTGIDIFTSSLAATNGQLTRILIFTNPGPATYSFTENLTSLISVMIPGDPRTDVVIAHADFTVPVTIAAGTFFAIGMSGEISNLGLIGLETPSTDPTFESMQRVDNGVFTGEPQEDGNLMAFRLHATVPDSGSNLVLLGLGLLGIVTIGKRLRR